MVYNKYMYKVCSFRACEEPQKMSRRGASVVGIPVCNELDQFITTYNPDVWALSLLNKVQIEEPVDSDEDAGFII